MPTRLVRTPGTIGTAGQPCGRASISRTAASQAAASAIAASRPTTNSIWRMQVSRQVPLARKASWPPGARRSIADEGSAVDRAVLGAERVKGRGDERSRHPLGRRMVGDPPFGEHPDGEGCARDRSAQAAAVGDAAVEGDGRCRVHGIVEAVGGLEHHVGGLRAAELVVLVEIVGAGERDGIHPAASPAPPAMPLAQASCGAAMGVRKRMSTLNQPRKQPSRQASMAPTAATSGSSTASMPAGAAARKASVK